MAARPQPVHVSRSFTRMAPAPTSPARKRATTLQEAGIPAIPEARRIDTVPEQNGRMAIADVFENREDEEEEAGSASVETSVPDLPRTFEELPVEIRSLTERFVESLSAKVHPQPLTADALSELFQDFYERAASHIATHIATLSSRIGRDRSPTLPLSAKSPVKGRSRAGSGAKKLDEQGGSAGGEMLTVSEVADRRKARRMLEIKRIALEEAVERAVTERIYDRIWKHRSTDDDARDEKLRSRTAALALVGIGLKELHMDSDPNKDDIRKATAEREDEIHQSLASAREALQCMDDEHYPLGKLKHLTEAHKSIVETLSQLFPSTSSADEILPTLIYTLITSPPEGINAVSNLNFIQRFRTSSKVDGEAAYCLVNLEAAISFLETVDLSSLRSDEPPEGPPKATSRPVTPPDERSPTDTTKAAAIQTGVSTISVESRDISSSSTSAHDAAKALPSPKTPTRPVSHRRLSSLVQAQADRIETGRANFLNATDRMYDSINGTLENSLQFVFGRFKDQNLGDSPLPKTLEDARKLVSPSRQDDDDGLDNSGRSSPTLDGLLGPPTDSKVLELIGGRKQLRDRSVDSTRSGGSGSGKRVAFTEAVAKDKLAKDDHPTQTTAGHTVTAAPAPATDLFSTINPLRSFKVPSFPRFARGPSLPFAPMPSPGVEKANKLAEIAESPPRPPPPSASAAADDGADGPPRDRLRAGTDSSATSGNEDMNAREALAELRRIPPPRKRFLDASSAAELRIGEMDDLLREYRRLAKAIGEAIAQ